MKEIIASLVAAIAQPQKIDVDGHDIIALPPGWITEDNTDLRDSPVRVEQVVTMTGLPSFLDYVNRFKGASSSIFITPDLTQLANGAVLARAFLDYHTEDAAMGAIPAWLRHEVKLTARPSLAYAKLLAMDGKLMDQPTFATSLEDIARFASSHDAADLLEIARTLSLTSKGDFKSFEDEFSGSVDFRYDLAVRASAGTQERKLSVPSHIDFTIPLIDGLSPVQVQAKLLYRVPDSPGGKVSLGVRIVDRVWLEEAAITETAGNISEATSLPVYVGSVNA